MDDKVESLCDVKGADRGLISLSPSPLSVSQSPDAVVLLSKSTRKLGDGSAVCHPHGKKLQN